MNMDEEGTTLAVELIGELKASARRWFIIAIIELIIIFATAVGMYWYFSLPVEEVAIENDDGNATFIGKDLNGGLYNGTNSIQAESRTESE